MLTEWIPRGQRAQFAEQVGVAKGYLDQLCGGYSKPTADLCVRIEQVTLGRVTRVALRPDLFGEV